MRFDQITDLAHQISEEFGLSITDVLYRQKESFSCLRAYPDRNLLILQRTITQYDPNQIIAILYVTFARHLGRTNSTKYFQYTQTLDSIQHQKLSQSTLQFAKRSMKGVEGTIYNLQKICSQIIPRFGIVFQDPFSHQLPRIGWSSRASFRKFGSYYPKINTITLSKSLDSPLVPEYVVNYVLYHELLHASLGTKLKNARQIAHSPEFHRLERLHPEYERANAFLKQYTTILRKQK
jgi:hypothetical protein